MLLILSLSGPTVAQTRVAQLRVCNEGTQEMLFGYVMQTTYLGGRVGHDGWFRLRPGQCEGEATQGAAATFHVSLYRWDNGAWRHLRVSSEVIDANRDYFHPRLELCFPSADPFYRNSHPKSFFNRLQRTDNCPNGFAPEPVTLTVVVNRGQRKTIPFG